MAGPLRMLALLVLSTLVASSCHSDAAPVVAVSVSPGSIELSPGMSKKLTAVVTGTANTGVTWAVLEANGGTVAADGTYTAPNAEGTFHVVATSVADPTKSGSAEVVVLALSILSSARRTLWNPGVPGGVPVRTTVCATVEASKYGNGTQDASAGIQTAIDACPAQQVVQLSAGTFLINGDELRMRSGVTLRGAGPDKTTLTRTNGCDYNPLRVGANSTYRVAPLVRFAPNRFPSYAPSTNLTADATKGAYTVNVESATGLAVGEVVLIDEVFDPDLVVWEPTDLPGGYTWFSRYQRPNQEFKEIQAISGTVVTFNTPMHMTYKKSLGAQLTPMNSDSKHVRDAGLENVKLRGGSEGNVVLNAAAYSWVKNVDCTYWGGVCVALMRCFRCELRDSFLHDGEWPYPGGSGYALSFEWGTSDSLVENNISMTTIAGQVNLWPDGKGAPTSVGVNKVMVSRAAGAGSVVGYNYVDNGIVGYDLDWMEVGLNGSHMVGSHHILFEGNHAFNADGDRTHGNQAYHTFYRNHLTGLRTLYKPWTNIRCAGLATGNWWMTFIGNVLGLPTPAWRDVYKNYESSSPPWDQGGQGSIWKLGYNDANWGAPADPKVLSTLVRHGNFDYLRNTVTWDPGSTDRQLPKSLYLTSKPAFFGARDWPWVDPTADQPVKTLPAKDRYDSGHPFASP